MKETKTESEVRTFVKEVKRNNKLLKEKFTLDNSFSRDAKNEKPKVNPVERQSEKFDGDDPVLEMAKKSFKYL